MDILHLVDRLEELFNNSKPIPLSRNVVVDENSFMDIIDQMRISIPDEIKKAQQVIAQKRPHPGTGAGRSQSHRRAGA
jgi:hypothetical protein